MGVVSEPAPTPVIPIRKPIKHPPATIHGLANRASMTFVTAAFHQFDGMPLAGNNNSPIVPLALTGSETSTIAA
jgi:hypothetical protein